MRMKRKNLRNIRHRFEEKTGVELIPRRRISGRKVWVLAAAIVACLAMAAFTEPLFSSLDGDEVSFAAEYRGDGVVRIRVENRSDKVLEFQHQTKLMRWATAKEVEGLGGRVKFENTKFRPRSEGVMTVDLSEAYDVAALEESHGEWFYLVLTNNEFLFGQDWMCSVDFASDGQEVLVTEAVSVEPEEPSADIEEELRFYFQERYTGELMAFNGANFRYQQKVEEMKARFEGTLVPALSPTMMVGGPSGFLDPEPVMGKIPEGVVFDETVPREKQYLLTLSDWTYTDGYGRMVAGAEEKAWAQTVLLPQRKGETDGGTAMPLVFLMVYEAEMARAENSVFLYGRFLSFGEMAEFEVLRDEHYAVYDVTDLIYTDVDAYAQAFLAGRSDVYWDEQVRQRVRNARAFYRDPENIRRMYGYLTVGE